MTTTRNLKGKLARELDAIRARIDLDHMTAEELKRWRKAAINLAWRANKAVDRQINGKSVDAFINAKEVSTAAYVTVSEIGFRITELEKAAI